VPISVRIVRGHLATPWELRPWRELGPDFEAAYLLTESNAFATSDVGLPAMRVRTRRDLLPAGRTADIVAGLAGDRYLGLDEALRGADVVHAEELSFWFAAEAARARRRLGFRLVQTVWETIPFLDAFRNREARRNRREVLDATDLFLPATERARDALLLEGVAPERIRVCPPGIDLDRFRRAAAPHPPPAEHVVISPGRLVWEKGHQDVLRAVAALRRGLVAAPAVPRVLLVGAGPEEARLRAHAAELGIADLVEVTSVPYERMPAAYARASCLVLASLPTAAGGLHLFDRPRVFWEEQFGLVLAEAMVAGLALVVSTSGAIPEVVGPTGAYVAPGDWMGIARALADGPLRRPPGARVEHPAERVERYATSAMAGRLADAYRSLVGPPPAPA
jgi:glycosyltransferase involved in cell wall biosynthesis